MYKSSIVIGVCVDLYIILHVKEEINRTYDNPVLWYFWLVNSGQPSQHRITFLHDVVLFLLVSVYTLYNIYIIIVEYT